MEWEHLESYAGLEGARSSLPPSLLHFNRDITFGILGEDTDSELWLNALLTQAKVQKIKNTTMIGGFQRYLHLQVTEQAFEKERKLIPLYHWWSDPLSSVLLRLSIFLYYFVVCFLLKGNWTGCGNVRKPGRACLLWAGLNVWPRPSSVLYPLGLTSILWQVPPVVSFLLCFPVSWPLLGLLCVRDKACV